LRVIDNVRKLRLTNLNNTSNIRVTLNVFYKFLIMFRISLKLTKSTNITLELRYRYNNFKSLKLLIKLLENYFELSI